MSFLTSVAHPLLSILADLVAFFYSVTSSYAIAIAFLTILVYLLLTPLLVKQTRSMIEMQRVQPEVNKIRQKYKGKDMESRQALQQEMMAVYKQHGVNPMGGCLPALLQFPVLIVMYAVIRGLLNRLSKNGKPVLVNGFPVARPEYIAHTSALYKNLVLAHGKMMTFGVDLSQAAGGHHSSFINALPYYLLVIVAAGLSLGQIQQMTIRNRKIMTQTPQMLQMQRMQMITPLIMTVIYWRLPVALSVYFIASSLFRIFQQEMMYRFDPVLAAHVKSSIAAKRTGLKSESDKAQGREFGSKASGTSLNKNGSKPSKPQSDGAKSISDAIGESIPEKIKDSGAVKPNIRSLFQRPPKFQNGSTDNMEPESDNGPRPHPRSKSKRPRKDR